MCIDDFSRYLILAEQFDHTPSTVEVTSLLDRLGVKPEKILTDNAKIFAKKWKLWCMYNEVESLYAHPYYPQDKGKVERTIRNIAEEFVDLLVKFPLWLDGKIEEHQQWYSTRRYHGGTNNYPEKLYVQLGS